jgi:hypothetical protein
MNQNGINPLWVGVIVIVESKTSRIKNRQNTKLIEQKKSPPE